MSKLLTTLVVLTILSITNVHALAGAVELPGPQDYLEADSAVYESGGTWRLQGNIILHLESLLSDTPLEITAEEMLYDEANQLAQVPGELTITLTAHDLWLSGQGLTLNLRDGMGEMVDVQAQVSFDPSLLADETGLVNQQYVRLTRGKAPELLLTGERALLERDESGDSFIEFQHARLVTSASDEPDLVLQVQSLLFHPGRYASFRNLRVSVSGTTVLYAPRWKQRYRKGVDFLNTTVPLPGRDSEDGWYIQQALFADRGQFHVDVYSRYYFDLGLRSEAFLFTDTSTNSRLGLTVGRRRTKDFYDHSVGRTTYYDLSWRLQKHPAGLPLDSIDFGLSYGRLKQDTPSIASRRGYAFAEATTPPAKLGGNLRLIGSAGVHYWNYSYGNNEFLAFKQRVKLARSTPVGLDFVQFVHADKFGASPFRFDDNFPENELTFQKNFLPLPKLSARMSGRYNYDREHFDNLVGGISHEFRSYWTGLSYDFARGSMSVELAIKF